MKGADLLRVPAYYHRYITLVNEENLSGALQQHQTALLNFLTGIPAEKWDYAYAPGKWSIKDVVQHVIDTERIFNYRALCIARGDKTPLPGFDENSYASAANANSRTKADLLLELSTVQKSTALLFASLNQEQLNASGVVNGNENFVRGIGYIIAGHALHHLQVIENRYLA